MAPNSFKDYVSQPKKSGYQALQSATRGALARWRVGAADVAKETWIILDCRASIVAYC